LQIYSHDPYIYADDGDDTAHGDAGYDYIAGDAGNDTLYGDDNNDTLYGDSGADHLYGGDGDDAIYGGADADDVCGNNGNDVLRGEDGDDYVYGGEGNDRVYGNAGDDFVYGDTGDDCLYGGSGADQFHGGNGSDTLVSLDAGTVDRLFGENDLDSFWTDVSDDVSDAAPGENATNVHRISGFVNAADGADLTLDGDNIDDPTDEGLNYKSWADGPPSSPPMALRRTTPIKALWATVGCWPPRVPWP
jgi:Ca2+-binding RTX toxin-like protein